MTYKIFTFFLFIVVQFAFAQQNLEFKSVKGYYDHQRSMINNELKKRFDKEENAFEKIAIKNDFKSYMQKLDSIQNFALIGALISVKNREDLAQPSYKNLKEVTINKNDGHEVDQIAEYPGGINAMREKVAELFYTEAINPDQKTIKTSVAFVVEKDGSISFVHAEGDNATFNRQAEIAIYLLPEKFSPALVKGNAVRYRFRLPLAMNFE